MEEDDDLDFLFTLVPIFIGVVVGIIILAIVANCIGTCLSGGGVGIARRQHGNAITVVVNESTKP